MVALGVSIYAARLTAPAAHELRADELSVEAIDMLVVERNQQRIGPALFLAEPKPQALRLSGWAQDVTTVLFHDALGLGEAELAALNEHAPAQMTVGTWNGVVVSLTQDGQDLISPQTFTERLTRKRSILWASAAACALAAAAALVLARRQARAVPATRLAAGDPNPVTAPDAARPLS